MHLVQTKHDQFLNLKPSNMGVHTYISYRVSKKKAERRIFSTLWAKNVIYFDIIR